jgi:RNA methyltransferase, TrmH family
MRNPKFISSSDNATIKRLKASFDNGTKAHKTRQEIGLAVIEGIHLVQAWLGSSDLLEIFTTEEGMTQAEIAAAIDTQLALLPDTELFILDAKLWKSISDLGNAPQIMASIRMQDAEFPPQLNDDVLILDGIQDAGNVGSIIRTAAASGLKHVVCMKGTAQAWSPKVLRAGMGAHRHLKIHEGWSLNTIREKIEIPLFATTLEAEESLYDLGDQLKTPKAWVFGNEGAGVSPEIRMIAKGILIPQDLCVESLNVGAAVAVCLFEMKRIREYS